MPSDTVPLENGPHWRERTLLLGGTDTFVARQLSDSAAQWS